jgi:hypothetical protein
MHPFITPFSQPSLSTKMMLSWHLTSTCLMLPQRLRMQMWSQIPYHPDLPREHLDQPKSCPPRMRPIPDGFMVSLEKIFSFKQTAKLLLLSTNHHGVHVTTTDIC